MPSSVEAGVRQGLVMNEKLNKTSYITILELMVADTFQGESYNH